jgi:hypothetical protein
MPGPFKHIPKRPGLDIKSQNSGVIKEDSNKAKLTSLLTNKNVKKTLSTFATEAAQKAIKGGARLNLLAMMLSPTSAKADPVIDSETGVNRFTGKTEFTPINFFK